MGKGSLIVKEKQIIWKARLLCIVWVVWRVRNDIVFMDGILCIQSLKCSFVHLLWSDTKVLFVDGPTNLLIFWLGQEYNVFL